MSRKKTVYEIPEQAVTVSNPTPLQVKEAEIAAAELKYKRALLRDLHPAGLRASIEWLQEHGVDVGSYDPPRGYDEGGAFDSMTSDGINVYVKLLTEEIKDAGY